MTSSEKNEDSVDTIVNPENASSDDASNNGASINEASVSDSSSDDSDSSSDDSDSSSDAETEEYPDANDQDANGSDDDSDEGQLKVKKGDAPAAAAQAPSAAASRSPTNSGSDFRAVDLSARLISDVPLGADVLKVRVLPCSSPGEGIHVILSSSPKTWVKLDAAGTEAKLYESLETLGNITAQIGIARKDTGKAIGGLAGKRASRTAAFAGGYHDRAITATATFPESTFCVVGALVNTFGWSADSAVAVRLKEVLGPLVSDWASAAPRAINNDANIPLKLQKISGIPRAASSTPALCLEWVVREISQAAADGLDLHYVVETVDTETGKRDHLIAVTTNVGSYGGAICSDPDFTFPLLFAGPDAVAETVARLKWWGVAGFVVGRRVVATDNKGSRKRKRD